MTPPHEAANASEINVPRPPFRWGTRVVLPAALVLAFAAVSAGSLLNRFTPALAVETAPVVERPAVLRQVEVSETGGAEAVVQAAGWIEPDPFPTYATALTNGIVEEVLFLEGDAVVRGDVLARLIDEDAQLALERAQAEYRAAEEAWEANIEHVRHLAVSQAALKETRAMLGQARAELVEQRALLVDAEAYRDRIKTLLKDDVSTPQQFDSAKADAAAKAARVDSVRNRIAELEAKLARMEAEKTAAEQRHELRTEERQRLDLARVALAEAELRVERMEIRAPIDGVVMERRVEPGSMVMAFSENAEMARTATLYDPERLQVRVDVPLADAAKVGAGQRALVVVEVLPDQTFEGVVSRVTHHADIQKNTLEVKVALDAPDIILKPDMLARVRFLAAQEPDQEAPAAGLSVFAPENAIRNGNAWVVTDYDGEEGRAAQRAVETTGAEEEGWVEIAAGLQPGDLVIVSETAGLTTNQRIRVTPDAQKGGA
jgi:RND family efflux transporter MFP subunit